MDLVQLFAQQQIKDIERPRLAPGDVVRVETKIQEGEKTRLQTFEGMVLAIRGSGPSTTFTVRREVARFGVERIFPLYSPLITNIEIVKRQKVRRAKLTYLRDEGRRRFKEDVSLMQRHLKEEDDRKQAANVAAAKKAEEAKAMEEVAAQAEETKASEQPAEEKK